MCWFANTTERVLVLLNLSEGPLSLNLVSLAHLYEASIAAAFTSLVALTQPWWLVSCSVGTRSPSCLACARHQLPARTAWLPVPSPWLASRRSRSGRQP